MFLLPLFICLLIATYTDIKTHEIPVFLFPSGLIFCLITNGWNMIIEHLIYAVIVFLAYYMMALFFNGGGGDIIMMTCIAFMLGKQVILLVFLAHILLLIFGVIYHMRKKSSTDIPFAPFVLFSTILLLLL